MLIGGLRIFNICSLWIFLRKIVIFEKIRLRGFFLLLKVTEVTTTQEPILDIYIYIFFFFWLTKYITIFRWIQRLQVFKILRIRNLKLLYLPIFSGSLALKDQVSSSPKVHLCCPLKNITNGRCVILLFMYLYWSWFLRFIYFKR